MQFRTLGRTGLKVSAVSFGALQLGRLSQREANQIIHYCVGEGMNYIDTANIYGNSEQCLGHALQGIRNKVMLSTKTHKRNKESFILDVKNSFHKLRTDFIDILFVHDVSTEKDYEKVMGSGIIDYCQRLVKNGHVRHIAVSTHNSVIGEKLFKTNLFDIVMVAYNAANPETEENLIPLAKSMDLGIVVMKPFGGGILCEERSKQLGFSITAEEALLFAASQPDISCVIPGIDSMAYAKTAIKVANGALSLSEEQRKAIKEKVTLRGMNYCRGCGYCKPCGAKIDIPEVLKLVNRYEVFEHVNWAEMSQISREYSSIKVKGDACTRCGACVTRCPYKLPIPQLMQKAARI